ncbi:hypothetical protein [Roseateles paludis]|uniref:Uncharacterized protein n=1 Tax=Roseateles paludis TaxID=3145238 RepID=A0ABV0FZS2_9BURK
MNQITVAGLVACTGLRADESQCHALLRIGKLRVRAFARDLRA